MSRYIDADRLYKDITRSIDYCEDILEIVERQPAAEVAEVKHGRWEWKEDLKAEDENGWVISEQGYVCSECGFIGSDNFRYCPNCGAKMDEVEE